MKRIILLSLLGQMMCLSMYSQVRMRDIFASAPDSVFPLLTRNNRLDCIDFIENKMPARVKNRLDNVVELLKLGDAYLQLRTSERSIVEMRLLSDSLMCLIHTYMGPAADSRVTRTGRPDTHAHQGFGSRTHTDLHPADQRAGEKRKRGGTALCATPRVSLGREVLCTSAKIGPHTRQMCRTGLNRSPRPWA